MSEHFPIVVVLITDIPSRIFPDVIMISSYSDITILLFETETNFIVSNWSPPVLKLQMTRFWWSVGLELNNRYRKPYFNKTVPAKENAKMFLFIYRNFILPLNRHTLTTEIYNQQPRKQCVRNTISKELLKIINFHLAFNRILIESR